MALPSDSLAPDFTLPATSMQSVRLSDQWKTGPVVLFFFPKAFTTVCTAEACAFRTAFPEFQQIEATVYGISRDSVAKLTQFKNDYQLPFDLLSDKKGTVCRQYDALIPIVKIPKRLTYVVGADGRIKSSISKMLQADVHIQHALQNMV